jgi:hypothetical protein
MKTLILATVLVSTTAQASFYTINCSDATGSVKWVSGHVGNTATLVARNNIPSVTLRFGLDQLDLKFSGRRELMSETRNDCSLSSVWSRDTVYTAKVKITPRTEIAREFEERFGKMIETHVICHEHFNGMMNCRQ